jgi:hypothetical protein
MGHAAAEAYRQASVLALCLTAGEQRRLRSEGAAAARRPAPVARLIPPDTFEWEDRRCDGLSAQQYRLLDVLTDGPRLRDVVPFWEIAAHVWAGRRRPADVVAAIKQLALRTGNKLHQEHVRLYFRRRRGLKLVPLGGTK